MSRHLRHSLIPILFAIWLGPLAAQNHAPTVITTPGPLNLSGAFGTSSNLNATAIFADQDIIRPGATQVNFGTELGTLSLEMLDTDAPLSVQNFLAYVQAGRYDTVFWHRSVPNFVIQTGGFTFDGTHTFTVQEYAPVVNEFHVSNTRGTVAMATVTGDPNSATSQWFINLANNSALLDTQNGGYTVFAKVIEGSMSVADAIAGVPTYNFGTPFDQLPLRNYPGSGGVLVSQMLHLMNITSGPNITFTATSDDRSTAQVTVNGTNFRIYPIGGGSANVTLKATDFEGLSAQVAVRINVAATGSRSGVTHTPALTHVSFRGMPTTHYAIDYADVLGGAWSVLISDVVSAADGTIGVDDTTAGTRRFYRARVLP